MNSLSFETITAALKNDLPRRSLSLSGRTRAAVLVPLVKAGDSIDLLLTRRTDTVETHKGQVSFPGGTVDSTDHDIVHTALRELDEEIGVHSTAVAIAGTLDDLATPTGFVITPVVGIIDDLPPLHINIHEVEEVFFVPLAFFLVKANGRSEIRTLQGRKYEVWFYEYEGRTIWGVTAAIIRNLIAKVSP